MRWIAILDSQSRGRLGRDINLYQVIDTGERKEGGRGGEKKNTPACSHCSFGKENQFLIGAV